MWVQQLSLGLAGHAELSSDGFYYEQFGFYCLQFDVSQKVLQPQVAIPLLPLHS